MTDKKTRNKANEKPETTLNVDFAVNSFVNKHFVQCLTEDYPEAMRKEKYRSLMAILFFSSRRNPTDFSVMVGKDMLALIEAYQGKLDAYDPKPFLEDFRKVFPRVVFDYDAEFVIGRLILDQKLIVLLEHEYSKLGDRTEKVSFVSGEEIYPDYWIDDNEGDEQYDPRIINEFDIRTEQITAQIPESEQGFVKMISYFKTREVRWWFCDNFLKNVGEATKVCNAKMNTFYRYHNLNLLKDIERIPFPVYEPTVINLSGSVPQMWYEAANTSYYGLSRTATHKLFKGCFAVDFCKPLPGQKRDLNRTLRFNDFQRDLMNRILPIAEQTNEFTIELWRSDGIIFFIKDEKTAGKWILEIDRQMFEAHRELYFARPWTIKEPGKASIDLAYLYQI